MKMKTSSAQIRRTQLNECVGGVPVLSAYPDPISKGKPYTIGYGSTWWVEDGIIKYVTLGMKITKEKALEMFMSNIHYFEDVLNAHFDNLNQNQFDALLDFIFNIGEGKAGAKDGLIYLKKGVHSTLYKFIKAGKFYDASLQFKEWDKGVASLQARHERQRVIFVTPIKVEKELVKREVTIEEMKESTSLKVAAGTAGVGAFSFMKDILDILKEGINSVNSSNAIGIAISLIVIAGGIYMVYSRIFNQKIEVDKK